MSHTTDTLFDVVVPGTALDDALRAHAVALAEQGAADVDTPVAFLADGTWLAAVDLDRRSAQRLRRQLQGLGLAAEVRVAAEDSAEDPAPESAPASAATTAPETELDIAAAPAADLGDLLLGSSHGAEPAADEPEPSLEPLELLELEAEAEPSTPDVDGPDLLSWFAEEDAVSEERTLGAGSADTPGAGPERVAPPMPSLELIAPGPLSGEAASPPAGIRDASPTVPPSRPSSPARPIGGGMSAMVDHVSRPPSAAGGRPRQTPEPLDPGFDGRRAAMWALLVVVAAGVGIWLWTSLSTPEAHSEQPAGPSAREPERIAVDPALGGDGVRPAPPDASDGEAGPDRADGPVADEVALSDRAAAADLFVEGKAKCDLGKHRECETTMQAVITLDPSHPDAYAWILKARAALERERREAAGEPIPGTERRPGDPPPEPKLIVVTPDTPRPSEPGPEPNLPADAPPTDASPEERAPLSDAPDAPDAEPKTIDVSPLGPGESLPTSPEALRRRAE